MRSIVAVAAAIALLAVASTSTATAQTALLGDLPATGIALVTSTGGSTTALIEGAATEGCSVRSMWITVSGRFVGFSPGRPEFVNAAWLREVPGDVPAGMPLLVVCGADAPPPSTSASPRADGLPNALRIGMADAPGGASARAAEEFAYRYQYLAGGVNTGNGWANWNPDGSFVSNYIEESEDVGIIPVFTYYMMRQSAPGASMGESEGNLANVADSATMRAYFEDLRLFFQRATGADTPVILHVEPDLWGYLQQRSSGNDASTVDVRVASSGVPELAGLPDTLAGFAQAIVRLRDRYAPDVLLGYHVSVWGTGTDIALADPSNAEVDRLAGSAASFYQSLDAGFDLVFGEFSDRDAAFKEAQYGDGGASWWDAGDFARFARFLDGIVDEVDLPAVLWQIPLGNTTMRAMNNSWNHYQDNRVEWLLDDPSGAHLRAYRDAGVIALLFGRGADGATCACDAAQDGRTDPPAINGNTRASVSADDDGGYFKERVREYEQNGALSLE
ncbi:MAG: hypothetical protein M0R75_03260 [Dehalococcoidia bacterium]|nr:hypothetical protein [Dehalococcoidia bacterium]